MMKLAREDLHQLAGPYAVDALDPAERDRFERHLHRCLPCAHEIRGLQATASRMGAAAASVPPERMRVQVLARAARTRQLPPVVEARHAFPRGAADPRRGQSLARWMPRLAVTMAAAGMAVVIVLGFALAAAQHQLSTSRARQAAIGTVLNASDARLLHSVPTKAGGTATALVSWRLHQGLVTLHGLRTLPKTEVYELWLIGGTKDHPVVLRPAGLAGRSGTSSPVLETGLRQGEHIAMTAEPAGGTRRPTTTDILVNFALPT